MERALLLDQMQHKDATTPLDQVLAEFPAQPAQQALSPQMANLLGNIVDAASTVQFLAAKSGHEANPLHLGGPQSLAGVGSSMAVGMASEHMLAKLLRKVAPGVADTLQSGIAAEHLGTGSVNVEKAMRSDNGGQHWAAYKHYIDALARNQGR